MNGNSDHHLDDPSEAIRQHLLAPSGKAPVFADDLYTRVAQLSASDDSVDLDFAVLFRQLLRRRSIVMDRHLRITVAPTISARLRRFAATVGLHEESTDTWLALRWQPKWLEATTLPDFASAAGSGLARRFQQDDLPADPFFETYTGHLNYRTAGQRSACRAVVSVPDGSNIIAMLPTGSGKTEIALCLAQRRPNSVTLIVVPTVALAYDFERRFRDHYARRNPKADPAKMAFAWTADTDKGLRERLRSRVAAGTQPILVTSPESVTRALRDLLLNAAATGRLGGFVVDEAHLVTQWGRDFRPEFRTLGHLRDELKERATEVGHPSPTTLLLSATLGSHELMDLWGLFGSEGSCTLIAANALRPEPDIWIHRADDEAQRAERTLEALAHLPRPAVLYFTSPEKAAAWYTRLREDGYQRVALVTGDTAPSERAAVLTNLRATNGNPGSVDLVVATSAFGLGIDYGHIRTVIHACLPETVDRWYQELGRGGRDGNASVAMLLTAPPDYREAASLGIRVLTADTARVRWLDLWHHRIEGNHKWFVDLEGSRGVRKGSYNRRWNAQLLQGLVELEQVRHARFDRDELADMIDTDGEPTDWTAVNFAERAGALFTPSFWSQVWEPWQRQEAERSDRSLNLMDAVSRQSMRACAAIARTYRPRDEVYQTFGDATRFVEPAAPCGRCPGCRAEGSNHSAEPPPWPPQRWPLDRRLVANLEDLADAAGAREGLILLTTDDHEGVVAPLARRLARRGVGHVAGAAKGAIERDRWLFVDPTPINPVDLTPCSSFVIYPPPRRRIPVNWLSPRLRQQNRSDSPPTYDVLLVPPGTVIGSKEVGRDLPALAAESALHVLGSYL